MANFFEVAESTINNWKGEHPEFLESIKRGKDKADGEVASSLFKRALGYEHEAVKIMQYEGAPVIVPYTEKYPPDTAAMIFWLKNRKKAQWRERIEHAGDPENPIQHAVTHAIVVPKKDAVGEGQASARASVGADRAPG